MAKEIYISSVEGLQEALDALVAVPHRYADVTALLADQAAQANGQLMRVADASTDPNVVTGSAYYDYTGAETADLGDYFLVSAPESASLSDGIGTTANGNSVDLGGGNEVTGTRQVTITPAGSSNKFLIATDASDPVNKRVHTQQDIVSLFSNDGDSDSFAGMGIETQGNNYPAGHKAGFYIKQGSGDFGAGMYASPDGYMTIFQGALKTKMKGLRFYSDFPDIDWATDLAADGLLVPHQKRVQELIDSGAVSLVHVESWYVDSVNGNDSNDGSPQSPFATITKANTEAADGDTVHIRGSHSFVTNVTFKELKLVGVSSDSSFDGFTEIIFGSSSKGGQINVDSPHLEFIDIAVEINSLDGTQSTNFFKFTRCAFSIDGVNTVLGQVTELHDCTFIGFPRFVYYNDVRFYNCSNLDLEVDFGGITNNEFNHCSGNFHIVDVTHSATVTLETSRTTGDINMPIGFLNINNSVASGIITAGTITRDLQAPTPIYETTQSVVIGSSTVTDPLVLDPSANVINVRLGTSLVSNWQPSAITGWVVGRTYTWFIVKEVNVGVDFSVARAALNVGYDDDIDPFAALIDVDTTQQRAFLQAVGFKSTFGQFGRLIITDSNYAE